MITAATLYECDIVLISCRMQRVKGWHIAICNISEIVTDSKKLEVNMQFIWLMTHYVEMLLLPFINFSSSSAGQFPACLMLLSLLFLVPLLHVQSSL